MTTIFTINGYSNYGNRLQLFALSKILGDLDKDVSVYWPKSLKFRIREMVAYGIPWRTSVRKEKKLKKFTERYLPRITDRVDADYLIIGSDQVWNPSLFKDCQYLLNVPGNSKKISYAASMGVESLTEVQKKMFEDALRGYDAVSVREKTAQGLLQPLTDKRVETVLDPTLLLDTEVYSRMEKRPRCIEAGDKYILCYILGNRDYQDEIEKLAKRNGLKVIVFSDRRDSHFGVEEFLYLIHHARLVCTDSFHACVFSFLFDRPFVVFKRSGKDNNMYSRLRNFLDVFHLKGCEFDGNSITESNFDVDYSDGKKILKKERRRSMDFLKNVMEVNNG